MVSFVCDACQSTLKKNKVSAHARQCHSWSYSCIDCSTTFSMDELVHHTQCVSEAEKHGHNNFKKRPQQNSQPLQSSPKKSKVNPSAPVDILTSNNALSLSEPVELKLTSTHAVDNTTVISAAIDTNEKKERKEKKRSKSEKSHKSDNNDSTPKKTVLDVVRSALDRKKDETNGTVSVESLRSAVMKHMYGDRKHTKRMKHVCEEHVWMALKEYKKNIRVQWVEKS